MSFIAPDWRDESNYPDPVKVQSLSLWAWEFLRRNPLYQAAWDGYVEKLRAVAVRLPEFAACVDWLIAGADVATLEEGELIERDRLCALVLDQPELFYFDPPALPGETIEDWGQRVAVEERENELMPLDRFLGREWRLGRLVNPAWPYLSQSVRFLNSGTTLVFGGARTGQLRSKPSAHDHIFTGYLFSPHFDLRLPEAVLRAQFSQILAIRANRIAASDFVPYSGRPEKSLPNFRNYLRTLDGLAADVKLTAIAERILPHYSDAVGARKTVENWRKKAIKIRDVEYAQLPVYAEISIKKKVKKS